MSVGTTFSRALESIPPSYHMISLSYLLPKPRLLPSADGELVRRGHYHWVMLDRLLKDRMWVHGEGTGTRQSYCLG